MIGVVSSFITFTFPILCMWVNACQTTSKHLKMKKKKHEIGLKYQQCLGSVKI